MPMAQPLNELAQGSDPANLDADAVVRAIKSYRGGHDDDLIYALDRILEDPRLSAADDLSDGLIRLVKQGSFAVKAAASEALTTLWTTTLMPLSDAELRRASRAARSLDAASTMQRMAWALVSESDKTLETLAPHINADVWKKRLASRTIERLPHPYRDKAFSLLFEDASEKFRILLLELLDASSDPGALERIAPTLPDASSAYLKAIARTLERMNKVEGEPILLAIVSTYSHTESEDRLALEALTHLGTAASVPVLRSLSKAGLPGSVYRTWVGDALEGIERRLGGSERKGAISLSRMAPERGGLSLSADGAPEGAMSLYEQVWRQTNAIAAPTEEIVVQPEAPNIPFLLRLTWPLFNSMSSYLIALALFLMPTFFISPRINALGIDSLLALGYPEDLRGSMLMVGIAGVAALCLSNLYHLRRWRKRTWFELLDTPRLTRVNARAIPAPRIRRFNRPYIIELTWVDEFGVPCTELRDISRLFRQFRTHPSQGSITCWALTYGDTAFLPSCDTPFALTEDHRLRLPLWYHFVFWYAVLFTPLNLYLVWL